MCMIAVGADRDLFSLLMSAPPYILLARSREGKSENVLLMERLCSLLMKEQFFIVTLLPLIAQTGVVFIVVCCVASCVPLFINSCAMIYSNTTEYFLDGLEPTNFEHRLFQTVLIF